MIDFQVSEVEMPKLDLKLIKQWIGEVCAAHGRRPGDITYMFCNDDYIIDVNRKFLNHDFYTDVITFDYSKGKSVAGDILISLDTVASNADQFQEPYERELLRVIIHGVLHLCGIDDKGPGEREVMEVHENQALEIYNNLISK